MTRYWIIAPVEANPADRFDKVWQFDMEHHLISIGWQGLGDVSGMSREELATAVAAAYPAKPAQTQTLIANMLWAFYHEIQPGDVILARRGRKMLAAVGDVTRPAFYTPEKNAWARHSSFLEVAWREQPRDKTFADIVFPMHTLAETTAEKFHTLVEGTTAPSVELDAPEAVEDTAAFVLEKYLEDFIVSNFAAIFQGELEIYEDDEGNNGQQYSTDIGWIDILAVEPRTRAFVVMELKKGRPSDQVVGQVLRYMGWVKQNLATAGQAVKGLVICRDPDPKLSYALEMTSNIGVRYYSVSFKLRETS